MSGIILPFDDAAGIIAPGGPQTRNPRYFAVPDRLIGYWPFDADCAISSTLSADLSGFGRNATLIGSPPLAEGRVGYGLSCNGTSQAASAAIDLSGTNVVTLCFWLNQTTFANADRLAFLHTADFNANAGAFVVNTSSSDFGGGNTMEFGAHGVGLTFNLYGVVQPSAGAWHHYALVISTVQGAQVAYIDGVSKSLSTLLQSGDSSPLANSTLYMMSKAGASQWNSGILDNVKLYPRKLDPWEVLQDYQAGLAGRRDAGAWLPGECEMPMLLAPRAPTVVTTTVPVGSAGGGPSASRQGGRRVATMGGRHVSREGAGEEVSRAPERESEPPPKARRGEPAVRPAFRSTTPAFRVPQPAPIPDEIQQDLPPPTPVTEVGDLPARLAAKRKTDAAAAAAVQAQAALDAQIADDEGAFRVIIALIESGM